MTIGGYKNYENFNIIKYYSKDRYEILIFGILIGD